MGLEKFRNRSPEDGAALSVDDPDGGVSGQECISQIVIQAPSCLARIAPDQVQLGGRLLVHPGDLDRADDLALARPVVRNHLLEGKSDSSQWEVYLDHSSRGGLTAHGPPLIESLDPNL